MIKRHKAKQDNLRYQYRTNERIQAPSVRVLDQDGKQIGVFSRREALQLAANQGLDLVEIAPQAQPPVVKIIDFNKFLYQEAKKKQEEKRKAKVSETKEIRLGPFMSENDLAVMINRGREFLEEGDKIRLVVKFKGRQITHPEFGNNIINRVIDALKDFSKVDREPHMEGKQMIALLSPERKKHAEKKDQKISSTKI
ncbi:MAG: translation initiation factor IF-3 [Patescibacteria group bacterium]|nr:MAG: translation initiation factor IF-3 [Patescibacteria group bacterium]